MDSYINTTPKISSPYSLAHQETQVRHKKLHLLSVFTNMPFILFLVFSFFLQGALGEIICEELPVAACSFSIASSGKRCSLETYATKYGALELQCKTSEVVVDSLREWVESDQCITACGADRNSIGISSDSLLESQFTAKLCSSACQNNCPNIVDLYHTLALAEGVFLPDMCKTYRNNPRRAMTQVRSSGAAAAGPVSASVAAEGPVSSEFSVSLACAPTPTSI